MRDYGKISSTFWTRGTGKQLRGDADAQLLALYLVTCQASNVIGIFYLPIATMTHETGLSAARIDAALDRLKELDFATYDVETETVWIPNLALHQIGETITPGDKRRTGLVLAEVKRAGKHRFLLAFWEKYGAPYQLGTCPSAGLTSIELECHPNATHQIRSDQYSTVQKQQTIAAVAAHSGSDEPSVPSATPTEPGTIPLRLELGSVPETSAEPNVTAVFEHWVATWKRVIGGNRKPVLNDKRRGKIRARLREGFTVADLKRSIDGVFGTPFNIENHHYDVELACRDEEHVTRYMATAADLHPAAKKFPNLPPLDPSDLGADDASEGPFDADDDPLADLLASDLNQPAVRKPRHEPTHPEGHVE